MKLFVALLFNFLSIALLAQHTFNFFEDTLHRPNFSSSMEYNYGSNAIAGDFLDKFIYGGKILDDLKESTFNRLSSTNRLGGDLKYKFSIELPINTGVDSTTLSLLVGAGQREHLDASFSKDLFQLTFSGNKSLGGKKIDLSELNYTYYKYQQMRFGLMAQKKVGSKTVKKGAILSVIKGDKFQSVSVPNGYLFTEASGKEIELDVNYTHHQSDTSNENSFSFNGIGIATELFMEFILKNNDKVYVGMEDLGFIRWNNKSIKRATDSTFYYEGINITNIFDLNDSLLSDISKDSIIENISSTHKEEGHTFTLPVGFNLNYTKLLNHRWKINLGIYHKILVNYFPLIYTNTYYYFNPSMAVKAHLSYGGYGKLNTGLAIATSIKNRLTIAIGSNNIGAFISSDSALASSGYVNLKVFF